VEGFYKMRPMISTVTPLLRIPAERPGDRIRRARKLAGLDLRQLAELVQIDPTRISQWENYKDDPPEGSVVIDRIALACRVPAPWLHDGTIGDARVIEFERPTPGLRVRDRRRAPTTQRQDKDRTKR